MSSDGAAADGIKYRCPVCGDAFTKWGNALRHARDTGHGHKRGADWKGRLPRGMQSLWSAPKTGAQKCEGRSADQAVPTVQSGAPAEVPLSRKRRKARRRTEELPAPEAAPPPAAAAPAPPAVRRHALLVLLDLNGTLVHRTGAGSWAQRFVVRRGTVAFLEALLSAVDVCFCTSMTSHNAAAAVHAIVRDAARRGRRDTAAAIGKLPLFAGEPYHFRNDVGLPIAPLRVASLAPYRMLRNLAEVWKDAAVCGGHGPCSTILIDDTPGKCPANPRNVLLVPTWGGWAEGKADGGAARAAAADGAAEAAAEEEEAALEQGGGEGKRRRKKRKRARREEGSSRAATCTEGATTDAGVVADAVGATPQAAASPAAIAAGSNRPAAAAPLQRLASHLLRAAAECRAPAGAEGCDGLAQAAGRKGQDEAGVGVALAPVDDVRCWLDDHPFESVGDTPLGARASCGAAPAPAGAADGEVHDDSG